MRRDIDKRLRKLEATMRPEAAHSVFLYVGDYYAASPPLAPSPSPGWAVATIARPTPELAAIVGGVPFFWVDWSDPGAGLPALPGHADDPGVREVDADEFRAAVLAAAVDGTQRMALAGATKWVVASMVPGEDPAEMIDTPDGPVFIVEEDSDIEPGESNDHAIN